MRASVAEINVPLDITFTRDRMRLRFSDGRELSVPLSVSPRLEKATPAQLRNYRLIGGGVGIHWPALDEDLSVERLLDPRPHHRARRNSGR